MNTRRKQFSGRRFAGHEAAGQDYYAFHTALLARCYPKHACVSNDGTPVFLNTPQGQRLIGHVQSIDGAPMFVKHVKENLHLQRNMDAWGIDSRALDVLEARGLTRIRVITDTGATYNTSTSVYRLHGIPGDFGYGAQVFLPRKWWCRRDEQ